MKEDLRITQLRKKCVELLGPLRQGRSLLNDVRSLSLETQQQQHSNHERQLSFPLNLMAKNRVVDWFTGR
jgi:hypothetical protein